MERGAKPLGVDPGRVQGTLLGFVSRAPRAPLAPGSTSGFSSRFAASEAPRSGGLADRTNAPSLAPREGMDALTPEQKARTAANSQTAFARKMRRLEDAAPARADDRGASRRLDATPAFREPPRVLATAPTAPATRLAKPPRHREPAEDLASCGGPRGTPPRRPSARGAIAAPPSGEGDTAVKALQQRADLVARQFGVTALRVTLTDGKKARAKTRGRVPAELPDVDDRLRQFFGDKMVDEGLSTKVTATECSKCARRETSGWFTSLADPDHVICRSCRRKELPRGVSACGRCARVDSNKWCLSRAEPGKVICFPCYEKEPPHLGCKCADCGTTEASTWRKVKTGKPVCFKCFQREKTPQQREKPAQERAQRNCADCGTTEASEWRKVRTGKPVCFTCYKREKRAQKRAQ